MVLELRPPHDLEQILQGQFGRWWWWRCLRFLRVFSTCLPGLGARLFLTCSLACELARLAALVGAASSLRLLVLAALFCDLVAPPRLGGALCGVRAAGASELLLACVLASCGSCACRGFRASGSSAFLFEGFCASSRCGLLGSLGSTCLLELCLASRLASCGGALRCDGRRFRGCRTPRRGGRFRGCRALRWDGGRLLGRRAPRRRAPRRCNGRLLGRRAPGRGDGRLLGCRAPRRGYGGLLGRCAAPRCGALGDSGLLGGLAGRLALRDGPGSGRGFRRACGGRARLGADLRLTLGGQAPSLELPGVEQPLQYGMQPGLRTRQARWPPRLREARESRNLPLEGSSVALPARGSEPLGDVPLPGASFFMSRKLYSILLIWATRPIGSPVASVWCHVM